MKRFAVPLFFFLVLLPFVKRPWLFDDPSFLIAAKAAAQHPLTPHTYTLDLGGHEGPVWVPGQNPATTNPPFDAWALGCVIRVFGETAWPLHALMFLIAVLSLPAVAGLASFFVEEETAAVLVLAASPVFFLTSLTLYPHLFYFLFSTWALYCCLQACETGRWRWGLGFGLALAGAALSLYQWPVLLVLSGGLFVFRGRAQPELAKGLLFGLFLFGLLYGSWQGWETHVYGMTHLWASYRARVTGPYRWPAAILPLVFLGGAFPAVAVAWVPLYQVHRKWMDALMAAGVLLLCLLSSRWGGFPWHQALLFSFFLTSALAFLFFVGWLVIADRGDGFLVFWFLVEFAFVERYLGYPGAHLLLPLCLPAAFLVIRACEIAYLSKRTIYTSIAVLFCFSLVLAQADQSEANLGPRIAQDVTQITHGAPFYYWGNSFSGLSYYLKQAGGRTLGSQTLLKSGEWIVLPKNLNMQGPPVALWNLHLPVVRRLRYTQHNPWRTFSISDAAGWYSASWGPLPYTFSTGPVEDVFLFHKPK